MGAKSLKMILSGATAMGMLLASGSVMAGDDMPTREEMWKIIQQQQKQIDALSRGQAQTSAQIEATASALEQSRGASSGELGWWNRTHLGGYGELHYNGLKDGGNDEVDLHRFVLFVGHEFNDDIRFFSELEVEHALAGESKPGEIEVEQAFVELDLTDNHTARAGLFLLPVGILNETHEPNTFFGVERNPVEKNIIPATWWEAGVGLSSRLHDGFSVDLAVHSGLDVPTDVSTPAKAAKAFNIRSGRQKVAKADADQGAVTGRLKWTGMPGVELATSIQYQQDITQDNFAERIDATLFEAHADIQRGPFGLRALYARWDIGGNAPKALGKDEQVGWYVEPSYTVATDIGDVGVFVRYNEYDTAAGDNVDSEFAQTDVGINYWPHAMVVFKADMQFNNDPGNGIDDEILNLGVGLQF